MVFQKEVFCQKGTQSVGKSERVHAWERIQVGGTELIN